MAHALQAGLDVAFIVLSAYDEDPYVFAALRAQGARGYLLKTAGPEELARAICLVMQGIPRLIQASRSGWLIIWVCRAERRPAGRPTH